MADALLCALSTVPDGGAHVVEAVHFNGVDDVVVLRRGEQAWAYVNRCPHFSVCLDYEPGEVLTYDGTVVMCAHHSALFRFEDGHCIEGPCTGAALTPVAIWVEGGEVRCASGMPAVP